MDFTKQWILNICVTLIIATIMLILAPRASDSKFYKTVIKIFVLFSFILPFSYENFNLDNFEIPDFSTEIESNQNKLANSLIEKEINAVLESKEIIGSFVIVDSNISYDKEIKVNSITVVIPDNYDKKIVKKTIFDELSLNVDVIYVGQ